MVSFDRELKNEEIAAPKFWIIAPESRYDFYVELFSSSFWHPRVVFRITQLGSKNSKIWCYNLFILQFSIEWDRPDQNRTKVVGLVTFLVTPTFFVVNFFFLFFRTLIGWNFDSFKVRLVSISGKNLSSIGSRETKIESWGGGDLTNDIYTCQSLLLGGNFPLRETYINILTPHLIWSIACYKGDMGILLHGRRSYLLCGKRRIRKKIPIENNIISFSCHTVRWIVIKEVILFWSCQKQEQIWKTRSARIIDPQLRFVIEYHCASNRPRIGALIKRKFCRVTGLRVCSCWVTKFEELKAKRYISLCLLRYKFVKLFYPRKKNSRKTAVNRNVDIPRKSDLLLGFKER